MNFNEEVSRFGCKYSRKPSLQEEGIFWDCADKESYGVTRISALNNRGRWIFQTLGYSRQPESGVICRSSTRAEVALLMTLACLDVQLSNQLDCLVQGAISFVKSSDCIDEKKATDVLHSFKN